MAGSITACGVVADVGLSMTGRAQETISGGQFVKIMSGCTVGTTGNYATCIEFALADATSDCEYAVGMAINNAASGADVTVQLEGIVRATAGGAITALKSVKAVVGTDATSVQVNTAAHSGIGWALSSAASGEYVLVKLGKH